MPSNRVVLFVKENPFYLLGFFNSRTYMRGWKEPGSYNLFILKTIGAKWSMHYANSKSQCGYNSQIIPAFDSAFVGIVKIPETLVADYRVIINWAKAQKREKV